MKYFPVLFILLSSNISLAAYASPLGSCELNLESPTRLEIAISNSGSERIRRFTSAGAKRYAADSEVVAFAKEIEERVNMETHVGDSFSGLGGLLMVSKRNPSEIVVDISTVRIVEDVNTQKTLKQFGTRSDTLNPQFVKFMTGLFIGADRLIAKNAAVKTLKIKADVVNESLSYILLDLGFGTPKLGHTITREEIKMIIEHSESLMEHHHVDLSVKPKGGIGNRVSVPFEFEIALP